MSRKRRQKFEQRRSVPDASGIVRAKPVSHRPEAWAEVRRCWENVDRKIRLSGGSAVAGYMLGVPITPGLKNRAIRLVAHCVWRSLAGELIDVTPRSLGDVHFFADDAAYTVPSAIQPLPGLEVADLQEAYRLAQKELDEDCVERNESTKEYFKRRAFVSDGQHKTPTV